MSSQTEVSFASSQEGSFASSREVSEFHIFSGSSFDDVVVGERSLKDMRLKGPDHLTTAQVGMGFASPQEVVFASSWK